MTPVLDPYGRGGRATQCHGGRREFPQERTRRMAEPMEVVQVARELRRPEGRQDSRDGGRLLAFLPRTA